MSQEVPLQEQPYLVDSHDDFTRQEFSNYRRFRDRTSLWNGRRDIYLSDRKRRFTHIAAEEISERIYIMRPWYTAIQEGRIDQLPPLPFSNRNPTDALSMTDRPSVLRTLGEYVLSVVGKKEFDRIRKLEKGDADPLYRFMVKWDKPSYFPGNSGLRLLQRIINHPTFMSEHSDPKLWRSARHAFTLMQSLRPMRRMADLRNPEIDFEPNADGTNIGDNSAGPRHKLAASWILHRVFIRALHYRSLMVGDKSIGQDQLDEVLFLATCFLHDEVDNIAPHLPAEGQRNDPDFYEFRTLKDKLQECLNNLGMALAFETRDDDVTFTLQGTIEWNAHPTRFLPLLLEHLETPLTQAFPYWRLWSTLLSHANIFNDALDIEHVEDDLIRERIVIGDEEWLLHELLRDYPDFEADDLVPIQRYYSGEPLAEIEQTLKGISRVNRVRQSIALLKDWNRKRPWKQLYLVINTSPQGHPNTLPHIQEFHRRIAAMHAAHPQPIGQFIPSNRANIWSNSFLIHPIATTEPLDTLSCQELCVICQDNFEETPGTIVAQLTCNHAFHFWCIREHWDNVNTRKKRCPMCRNEIPSLATVINIKPEALDVWDLARVTTPAVAAAMRTLDEGDYEELNNEMILMSENWTNTLRNWDMDANGVVRLAERHINPELSQFRDERYAASQVRRMEIRQRGLGIASLEPQPGVDRNNEGAIADVLTLPPSMMPRTLVHRPRFPPTRRFQPY